MTRSEWHAERALELLEAAHKLIFIDQRSDMFAEAQVHSTLAVFYQGRGE